jgi:macrophage erythroblast attacher
VEIGDVEEQEASRCRARLQHLAQIGLPQKNHALEWNRLRVDRILADHMLRCGFLESATQLVNETGMQVSLQARLNGMGFA